MVNFSQGIMSLLPFVFLRSDSGAVNPDSAATPKLLQELPDIVETYNLDYSFFSTHPELLS